MYPSIKRALDFFFALIGSLLFLPFGLVIALLVKATSSGPVFFRQERVGKDCGRLRIYKFRTMRVETRRDGRPLSDAERMTGVGNLLRKLSLDEVPQFINILKGEMSFIGPRPLPVQYLPYYTEREMARHSVVPGISGWAQVNGRSDVFWDKKLEMDVYYVENFRFALDAEIFFKTLGCLFSGRGVTTRGTTAATVDFDVERARAKNRRGQGPMKPVSADAPAPPPDFVKTTDNTNLHNWEV